MDANQPHTFHSTEPTSFSTLQAWTMAVTRPNEDTYQALVDDPRANVGKAMAWVFVASLVSTVVGLGAQFVLGGLAQTLDIFAAEVAPEADLGLASAWGIGFVLCLAPVTAAMSAVGLLVQAGLLQFIAGAFGGQGSFSKLTYAIAAYTAPISVVSGLLMALPLLGSCLVLPLGIYSIVLNLLAVKAVNRLSWGRTFATVFTLMLVAIAVGAVLVLATFALIPWDMPVDFPLDRYRL